MDINSKSYIFATYTIGIFIIFFQFCERLNIIHIGLIIFIPSQLLSEPLFPIPYQFCVLTKQKWRQICAAQIFLDVWFSTEHAKLRKYILIETPPSLSQQLKWNMSDFYSMFHQSQYLLCWLLLPFILTDFFFWMTYLKIWLCTHTVCQVQAPSIIL